MARNSLRHTSPTPPIQYPTSPVASSVVVRSRCACVYVDVVVVVVVESKRFIHLHLCQTRHPPLPPRWPNRIHPRTLTLTQNIARPLVQGILVTSLVTSVSPHNSAKHHHTSLGPISAIK